MCHTSEGGNLLLGGAHGAVGENGDGDGARKKLDFRFCATRRRAARAGHF